jgi:hypothetical protein
MKHSTSCAVQRRHTDSDSAAAAAAAADRKLIRSRYEFTCNKIIRKSHFQHTTQASNEYMKNALAERHPLKFLRIPTELYHIHIIPYLTLYDIAVLRMTCKYINTNFAHMQFQPIQNRMWTLYDKGYNKNLDECIRKNYDETQLIPLDDNKTSTYQCAVYIDEKFDSKRPIKFSKAVLSKLHTISCNDLARLQYKEYCSDSKLLQQFIIERYMNGLLPCLKQLKCNGTIYNANTQGLEDENKKSLMRIEEIDMPVSYVYTLQFILQNLSRITIHVSNNDFSLSGDIDMTDVLKLLHVNHHNTLEYLRLEVDCPSSMYYDENFMIHTIESFNAHDIRDFDDIDVHDPILENLKYVSLVFNNYESRHMQNIDYDMLDILHNVHGLSLEFNNNTDPTFHINSVYAFFKCLQQYNHLTLFHTKSIMIPLVSEYDKTIISLAQVFASAPKLTDLCISEPFNMLFEQIKQGSDPATRASYRLNSCLQKAIDRLSRNTLLCRVHIQNHQHKHCKIQRVKNNNKRIIEIIHHDHPVDLRTMYMLEKFKKLSKEELQSESVQFEWRGFSKHFTHLCSLLLV